MGYFYAAMWILAGLILLFRMSRENKIFYLAGAFFLVLGGWWLTDAIWPEFHVFDGVPGLVLKGLTAVVLLVLAVLYYKLNRQGTQAFRKKNAADENKEA